MISWLNYLFISANTRSWTGPQMDRTVAKLLIVDKNLRNSFVNKSRAVSDCLLCVNTMPFRNV